MITISLCMLFKNEKDELARCLSSIDNIHDELILVIDDDAPDDIEEFARRYTDKVFRFKWVNSFAVARNFSFEQATQEYILWLDSDDILLPEDREKLQKLKHVLDPEVDYVNMYYDYSFDESGNTIIRFPRTRLVRRHASFKWLGAVHEYLQINDRGLRVDITVSHKRENHSSERNIKILENMLANGETFSAHEFYYYANELVDHSRYEEAIPYYLKYLETDNKRLEIMVSAYHKIFDCYYSMDDSQESRNKALEALMQIFKVTRPRPETCCKLGHHFLFQHDYETAIYWYKTALSFEKDEFGMQNIAFATWYPHLQLCMCYDKLSRQDLALEHIMKAYLLNPQHETIRTAYEHFRLQPTLDLATSSNTI